MEELESIADFDKAGVNRGADIQEISFLRFLCCKFLLLKVDVGTFASVAPSAPLFVFDAFAIREDVFEALSGLGGTGAGLGN